MAETNNFTIHALELGPMENFVYLLHDHQSDTAAIVDPAWDVQEVLSLADDKGIRITDILLTHSHHDHVNGIEKVLDHTDAQIHLLKAESHFWGKTLEKPKLHHGGDSIRIGKMEIEILHTPGHTPGSACYHLGNDLIAGDESSLQAHIERLLKAGCSAGDILHRGMTSAMEIVGTVVGSMSVPLVRSFAGMVRKNRPSLSVVTVIEPPGK